MRVRVAALALGACGCSAPGGTPPAPPSPAEARECDAAPAQGLVGRPASVQVAREARRLAGAGNVRQLRPGQVVTMEYRADRLNLHLDGRDRIERIACG